MGDRFKDKSIALEAKAPAAVIVGVLLSGEDPQILADDLDELQRLLSTLGIKVQGRVIQKRQKLTPKCLIGEGKIEEIKQLADSMGAAMIVFDHELSAPQVRNLEKMTCKEIFDRTGIILQIFSRHARTAQAKVQVEIAQLEYNLPRLAKAWTHFQRQAGGVRSRGMGEKQIEIDRRRARERISRLEKQLDNMGKDRHNQRKARNSELKVALVGYTNSGKTSVMNAMTKANVQAQDVLFATLDSNVRTLDPTTRPNILMSDTVGFIRKLPHGLVESFKSTLDEVLEADMLLHIVDVSHRNFRLQMETTEQVLREIGAGDIPVILVFNKMDLVEDPLLPKILKAAYRTGIFVSAHSEEDMAKLRRHVFHFFEENLVQATLEVLADDQTTLSIIYRSCLIIGSDYTDQERVIFSVRATPAVLAKLHANVISMKEKIGFKS